MADFYEVDLNVLAEMTKTLSEAGTRMGQALHELGGGEGGVIGPQVLVSAADSFRSSWTYGLGQLQQAIDECTEGVGRVHQNYQDTETTVQQAMKKISTLLQE